MMSGSWRKPSRSCKRKPKHAAQESPNDGSDIQSPLAIDVVRFSGRSSDARIPCESGEGALLAVVQRIYQVHDSDGWAYCPGRLHSMDTSRKSRAAAGSFGC